MSAALNWTYFLWPKYFAHTNSIDVALTHLHLWFSCLVRILNLIPWHTEAETKFMMTSSNGNIFRDTGPLCGDSPVTGEFPSQRPVTRSFDVFFDLRLNKQLSKQSWGWWFETPSRSLWRHCNVQPFRRQHSQIHFNEKIWISLQISMKFVPKVRISNITTLFQKMAWRRPSDKPLSEPIMVSLLTHICVTRSRRVNNMKARIYLIVSHEWYNFREYLMDELIVFSVTFLFKMTNAHGRLPSRQNSIILHAE